ncbi:MAG: 6-phosphogluconolactonase [Venatoribacter sp.]
MNLQTYENSQELANALAQEIASRMGRVLEKEGKVTIAVSGGTTPKLFLQQLSKEKLDWKNVIVTLVDERWVDADKTESNERFVRTHLLQNEAKNAWLVPLKTLDASVTDGYQATENRLSEELNKIHFAVLGMGIDGHCASWFPNSKALPILLNDSTQARSYPVTDAPSFPERLSLTWAFLAQCEQLYLHIEGAYKKDTLEKASVATELYKVNDMPVRKLIGQKTTPLTVFYCD